MKDAGEYQLGYRADIEGLRAVAILLVVAAHVRLPGLAGGFVGVDVFFVLSGYLITGLLLQQMHGGTFAFTDFYARRLRRLLPGLLLMLLVTCVLGYLLTAPDQQAEQATAGGAASIWLSNFLFAFGKLDYFSPGGETNLFLHTWSLGVEEQFYLVWPMLLAFAVDTRASDERRLRLVLYSVFAISLALCVAWTRTRPLLAFYMMPTRAWQFPLGALTFLAADARGEVRLPERSLAIAGWLGFGAILTAALWFDHGVPYPGVRALLPSLGAAAVLAAGSRGEHGVSSLLALRPMQAIGRVSYAWYLWHWPVLLLGAALVDMTLPHRLALAGLSLACGAASFHLVETPIRSNSQLLVRPRFAVLASVAIMLMAAMAATGWHHLAGDRMLSPELARYQRVRTDAPAIYDLGCDDWFFSATVHVCAFGNSDAAHTAVAFGDSIGLQWFPAYAKVFDRPGWRLLVITKSSCPMVDEPFFYARIGREFSECTQWRHAAVQEISTLHPDIVLVGSSHMMPYSRLQWTEGTARILEQLARSSEHVYLMRSTPTLPFDGPSCLEPRSRLYAALSVHRECVASAQDPRRDAIYEWLSDAAIRFKNVSLLDLTDVVCPHERCDAERNGVIVFRDQQHLSAAFAESLAGIVADRLNLPLQTDAAAASAIPVSSQ